MTRRSGCCAGRAPTNIHAAPRRHCKVSGWARSKKKRREKIENQAS